MKFTRNIPFSTAIFLIFAVLITLGCGLVFAVGHQIYRQNANDPQIQISEDMADYAGQGKDIQSMVPTSEVDIAKSQVWFVMFFDDEGQIAASNAKLDGQDPVVPAGVLEHAKKVGQHRVTWQPRDGVRIAAVVTKYNGGSVLVGKSLRETENRVTMLGKKVFVAWLVSVGFVFLATWFLLPKKLH